MKWFFIFLIVLVVCSTCSDMSKDIDDREFEARQYCAKVYRGDWPDFKHTYEQFCTEGKWNGR